MVRSVYVAVWPLARSLNSLHVKSLFDSSRRPLSPVRHWPRQLPRSSSPSSLS